MDGTTKKRISLHLIFLIGLGFATTQILWVHFNGFVPVILDNALKRDLGASFTLFGIIGISTIIGFIMTWDNIIAFFMQPYIGARSDKTRTRFGRRMPYILVGIPLAAVFFTLIPIAGNIVIWIVMPIILLFNFSMALYRSPAVSLMPDLVPTEYRSLANGIINLMGGLGSAVMLFIGARIYKNIDVTLSFLFGSILIVLLGLILFLTIKEPTEYTVAENIQEPGIIEQFQEMWANSDKSPIFMLLAILSWFIAWNAVEAFWTLYGKEVLKVNEADAQSTLFFFAVMLVLGAIPAGIIGQKIGRLLTMRIGLITFIILVLTVSFIRDLTVIGLLLAIAGLAWACINVNSIVVVWEHSRDNGGGTGLYYAFSSAAAITGPVTAGALKDWLGPETLFPFSGLMLIVAFIFLIFVKTGEAGDVVKPTAYLDTLDG